MTIISIRDFKTGKYIPIADASDWEFLSFNVNTAIFARIGEPEREYKFLASEARRAGIFHPAMVHVPEIDEEAEDIKELLQVIKPD